MSRFDPIAAMRMTLQDPRHGMRAVLGLRLSPGERLGAMVTIAILNVLSAEAFARQLPELPDQAILSLLDQPLVFVVLQLLGLYIMSGLTLGVGRVFGGRGDAAGAQMAILWLHVIFLVLQLAQVLALALVPPLTTLLGLASLAAALWFLPHFVAEVHGFRSVGLTFLGILGTLFALLLLLTLAMALILSPEA